MTEVLHHHSFGTEHGITTGGCMHPPHGHFDHHSLPIIPDIHHVQNIQTVQSQQLQSQQLMMPQNHDIKHHDVLGMPNPFSYPDSKLPDSYHHHSHFHQNQDGTITRDGCLNPFDSTGLTSTPHTPHSTTIPVIPSASLSAPKTMLASGNHVNVHGDKHGIDVSAGTHKGNIGVNGNVHNDFHGNTNVGGGVEYHGNGWSVGGHVSGSNTHDYNYGGTITFNW